MLLEELKTLGGAFAGFSICKTKACRECADYVWNQRLLVLLHMNALQGTIQYEYAALLDQLGLRFTELLKSHLQHGWVRYVPTREGSG